MKLFNLFKKKNEEQRGLQYISSYSDGLMFGGGTSNNTALNISAVYRAVELISDNIAILPIVVKNIEKDHISELEEHNILDVFSNRNNIVSKYQFIKLIVQSVILYGNGFAYIHRDKNGDVTNIQYLHPNDVQIHYNKNTNTLWYTSTLLNNQKIEPINILHFVKNTVDGIKGKSVISYANRSIQNANYTENQALSFFNSGCNLAGILTVQGQLNDQQKEQIRSSWNQAYSANGSGLAVLQGNMSYQPLQVSATDAQLIESRNYNVGDIARFFGVHPTLLGDGSIGDIEQAQQQFISYTLQPYIVMIEEELNRKLLKPSEYNLKIELNTTAILKSDKNATATYYSMMLDKGIMCINEVRKELGYNKIDGGDKHLIAYSNIEQNTINTEKHTNVNEQNI